MQTHLITVPAIPENGLDLVITPQTKWAVASLGVADLGLELDAAALSGQIKINHLEGQVHVSGQVLADYRTPCNRCGEPMVYHHDLAIEQYMAPAPKLRAGEVQTEIDMPDLEFAYYEGFEFDLAPLVHEQLLLQLPVQYVCSETCKGLCPRCGVNLNQETCDCAKKLAADSPWAVLQKIKK